MTRYDAVMRAADHIEQNPQDFIFSVSETPTRCGSPGCALGWIGYFGDLGKSTSEVAHSLSVSEMEFYNHMGELTRGCGVAWTRDSTVAVIGLRRYAKEHLEFETLSVWAQMRDREAQARLDAAPAYDRFRHSLVLKPLNDEVSVGHSRV